MKKGQTNPNKFKVEKDYIILYVLKKGRTYECLLDEADYNKEEIKNNRWCLMGEKYPYVVRSQWDGVKYHTLRIHRVILNKHLKGDLVVDHIDGNKLDNRRRNLRVTTQHNNTRNRNTDSNKTGVVGGHFASNGRIKVNIRHEKGKMIHIGTFDTKEEAIKARIEAEKKYWGHSFLEETPRKS